MLGSYPGDDGYDYGGQWLLIVRMQPWVNVRFVPHWRHLGDSKPTDYGQLLKHYRPTGQWSTIEDISNLCRLLLETKLILD